MSERVYEDGTPAAYEPKVYPWMREAAMEVVASGGSASFVTEVQRATRIIAEHAPESQPIRQGDVVQMIDNGWSATGVVIREPQHDWIQMQSYGGAGHQVSSPEFCVRIGRAPYYPDGTPVED